MKFNFLLVLLITFSILSLIPVSVYGQAYIPDPDTHRRILEEGYTANDVIFVIILVIIGISITTVFLHPRMRKKFKNYGN